MNMYSYHCDPKRVKPGSLPYPWGPMIGGPYADDELRMLRHRQREHLKRVRRFSPTDCLHNHCTECVGTGVKLDGSRCVHHISCPCPRCTPH